MIIDAILSKLTIKKTVDFYLNRFFKNSKKKVFNSNSK